jgi:tRNA(adenine34) deaminase
MTQAFVESSSSVAGRTAMHPAQRQELDARMMARCIELSRSATSEGEFPFACVVCHDDRIVVEATNRVARDGDITRHAELVAVSQVHRLLGKDKLKDCTLYSNVEPCPMCSFAIREAGIGRVIFSLRSPYMGGSSRWNILGDGDLSRRMPEAFGRAPEVVAGVLAKEAARVWRRWNPIVWGIIRWRGIFLPR